MTTSVAVRLKFNSPQLLFLFFTLISPPILLLLERGNLDILVFLLVVTSSYFLSKNRANFALLILIISSLVKFYTFPLLIFFFYSLKKNQIKFSTIIPILICSVWLVRDLLSVEADYIEITTASFGVSIPTVLLLHSDTGSLLTKFISVVIFSSIALFMASKLPKFISKKTLELRINHNFFELVLFVFCTLIHIMVFLLGMNFSYRLIYLIFAVILISSIIDLGSEKFIFRLKSLLLLGLWFSFNLGKLEFVGQIAIYIITLLLTVVLFQFLLLIWQLAKKSKATGD